MSDYKLHIMKRKRNTMSTKTMAVWANTLNILAVWMKGSIVRPWGETDGFNRWSSSLLRLSYYYVILFLLYMQFFIALFSKNWVWPSFFNFFWESSNNFRILRRKISEFTKKPTFVAVWEMGIGKVEGKLQVIWVPVIALKGERFVVKKLSLGWGKREIAVIKMSISFFALFWTGNPVLVQWVPFCQGLSFWGKFSSQMHFC